MDETDEEVFNSIYYKEVPVVTGDLDETLIVTYSPKYKAYQQRIRLRQIERAEMIINSPCQKRKAKNQNDPMRFVKNTAVTNDGEVAEKKRIWNRRGTDSQRRTLRWFLRGYDLLHQPSSLLSVRKENRK